MIRVTTKTKQVLYQDPTAPVCLTSGGTSNCSEHFPCHPTHPAMAEPPEFHKSLWLCSIYGSLSVFISPLKRQMGQWALCNPDKEVEVLAMTPRRRHGLFKLRMSFSAMASSLETSSCPHSALCLLQPPKCYISFRVHSSPLSSFHTANSYPSTPGITVALGLEHAWSFNSLVLVLGHFSTPTRF